MKVRTSDGVGGDGCTAVMAVSVVSEANLLVVAVVMAVSVKSAAAAVKPNKMHL